MRCLSIWLNVPFNFTSKFFPLLVSELQKIAVIRAQRHGVTNHREPDSRANRPSDAHAIRKLKLKPWIEALIGFNGQQRERNAPRLGQVRLKFLECEAAV